MTSLIDVDLQRQWTWRCASSYTAVARVAQKPNVKLAQQSNVANRFGHSGTIAFTRYRRYRPREQDA